MRRNATSFLNEPYVTGGNPVLAYSQDASRGGSSVFFNDILGSTIAVINNAATTETGMTLFGERNDSATAGDNAVAKVGSETAGGEGANELDAQAGADAFFTGKPNVEELGYAFLFRNYRPENAKWQTADPIGYPDGLNNFAYVNNGVSNSFDPSGLNFLSYGTIIRYGSYELEQDWAFDKNIEYTNSEGIFYEQSNTGSYYNLQESITHTAASLVFSLSTDVRYDTDDRHIQPCPSFYTSISFSSTGAKKVKINIILEASYTGILPINGGPNAYTEGHIAMASSTMPAQSHYFSIVVDVDPGSSKKVIESITIGNVHHYTGIVSSVVSYNMLSKATISFQVLE